MTEIVRVTCRCCGGAGTVLLTGRYAETLALLRARPGLNGAALARLAGCTGAAMANRLVRLEAMGLADRQHDGRSCLWRAAPLSSTGG